MININMAPLEELATSPGTLGTGAVGIRIRSGGPQCPHLREDDRLAAGGAAKICPGAVGCVPPIPGLL